MLRVSFIGGGARLRGCHSIFCGKSEFTVKGFFSNPVSGCAQLAIDENKKIYTNVWDLCVDSDIIVITEREDIVPSIVGTFAKLHVNNKIIVAFSDKMTSHDLDNGYPNTFIVFYSPVSPEHLASMNISDTPFMCEGFGDNIDILMRAASLSKINCTFVNKMQLDLFKTGMHLLHYGVTASILSGAKIMKLVGGNNSKKFIPSAVKEAIICTLGNSEAENRQFFGGDHINEIKEHMKLLDSTGIDTLKQMYSAISVFLTEITCQNPETADEIIRKIRSMSKI